MKKEKPETDKYKHTCVYAGRRLSQDGKRVYQRFIDSKGNEMLFKGVSGVWIGYTYKCSETQIARKPERVRDVERIDNPEWDAADALVDSHNARKRADAKIAKSTRPAMKAAIEAIRPLVRGLHHFERKALIEYLAVKSQEKKK